MRKKVLVFTFCLLGFACAVVWGDTIILKNGYAIDGTIIDKNEKTVTLKTEDGQIVIKRNEIDSIIETDSPPVKTVPEEPPKVIEPPKQPITPTQNAPARLPPPIKSGGTGGFRMKT